MSSQRRIESSRANGARSHGPITPEGKQRSSQNAVRHALLARNMLLKSESKAAFDDLLASHLDRFQPVDNFEFDLIAEMVSAHWRMERSWAIETRMLQERLNVQPPGDEVGRLAKAFEDLASSPALALLHRYETRLHNTYRRSLRNLLLMQEKGRAAESPAELPNDPNPIPEHPAAAPPAPADPLPQPCPPETPSNPPLPNEPAAPQPAPPARPHGPVVENAPAAPPRPPIDRILKGDSYDSPPWP